MGVEKVGVVKWREECIEIGFLHGEGVGFEMLL
jgi:hypothetical protein